MKIRIGTLFLFCWPLIGIRAGLSMSGLWGDHMVLQRDRPIVIQGRANPGQPVEVELHAQSARAVADAGGEWQIILDPMEAGGPYTLSITSGHRELRYTDILIGDVWLCSGQSNMFWPLNRTEDPREAIERSADPGLRLFTVARHPAGEPQSDVEGRWEISGPDTVGDFSAVAFYFGRKIRAETGVPVGLIHSSVGGTPVEAWMRREVLTADPRFAGIMGRYEQAIARLPEAMAAYEASLATWQETVRGEGRQAAGPRPAVPMNPTHPRAPSALYNGMIAPLTSFPIRGMLWYQGEANRFNAAEYRDLLPAMLQDWRRQWGSDFPVGIVQLSAFNALQTDPNGTGLWPWLREAQANVAEADPLSGLVITIDVGDEKDIHPRVKKPVGGRLARWALAAVYQQDVACRGPRLRAMRREGDTLVCEFDHAGEGLTLHPDVQPPGFAVAGEDRVFHWAETRIEADRVWVRSAKVPEPVAVRYAWGDFPPAGLFNSEGLPAEPFRTDAWPATGTR